MKKIHIQTVKISKYLYKKFDYKKIISKKDIKNIFMNLISGDDYNYDRTVRHINRAYLELKGLGNFNYDRVYVWIEYRKLINIEKNHKELFETFFKMFVEETIARGLPDVNESYVIKNYNVVKLFFLDLNSLKYLFNYAMRENLVSFGQLTGWTINLSRRTIMDRYGIEIRLNSNELIKKKGIKKLYLK